MNSFILQESPELLAVSLVLVVLGAVYNYRVMAVAAVLLITLLYFYRKPIIRVVGDPTDLLSPAFGTISRILPLEDNRVLVTIFLSPMDIHAQYFPCDGEVLEQIYDDTGKFAIASDAYKSDYNEKMITVVDSGVDLIKVTQLAGLMVRRISTPDHTRQRISQGDYLGFIKFGSRVDLEFSLDRYEIIPDIFVGYTVHGPSTRIAYRKVIQP